MITLHHLNNSRSQRILWLLEELALPYEVRRYERNPKTHLAPPELARVHPLGKAPIIEDGSLQLAESGAIIEYLVDRYGLQTLGFEPGTEERTRSSYWMHYAEGSAMPPLLLDLVFTEIERARMPFFVKPVARGISQQVKRTFIRPGITRHLDYLESELKRSGWLVGDRLSAADIAMSFPLEAADARGFVSGAYPGVRSFLDRTHARPAYQKALERGGPYSLEW